MANNDGEDGLDDDMLFKGFEKIWNKDLANAVGYVSLIYSSIEWTIYQIAVMLFDLEPCSGSILVMEMSLLQRNAAITSALHHGRKADLLDEWEAVEKRINAIRAERNNVIHGLWGKADGTHVLGRIKARRRLVVSREVQSIKSLSKLCDKMSTVITILGHILTTIKTEKVAESVKNPQGPPLDRRQSLASLAQAQTRARKRAAAQASRELAQTRKASQDGSS